MNFPMALQGSTKRRAGVRWCSSSSSVEPMFQWISFCWGLMQTVQPPVPSIIFPLIRKAAFRTAFWLELQFYRTSFRLAVLSFEIVFWGPANTLSRDTCARLPSWHNCSRRRYQHGHMIELPPNFWDQPMFCLHFFIWPEGCLTLLYTARVVLTVSLVECIVTYLCILKYFPEISPNAELYFACTA